MPRKRAAPRDSDASQAKKPKTTPTTAPNEEAAPDAPPAVAPRAPERWSDVSVSANIAKGHEHWLAKPDEAYAFECCCPPRFQSAPTLDSEDEEDDESEGEGGGEDANQPKCDNGETCLCKKKAVDHPDHPWVLSMLGSQMYVAQYTLAHLRDPDNFGMYTYNDHYGYGLIEMLQNMVVEFMHAANWREQWCVVEAAVMWLLDGESEAMMQVDAGIVVQDSYSLIGRMFLTVVARLDREGVMGEALNLGTIMALYIMLAQDARDNGMLADDEDEETVSPGVVYKPDRFDDYVLAYSKKHSIALRGPRGLDALIAECEQVKLPPSTASKSDPWKFSAAVKRYESSHGGGRPSGSRSTYRGIGGDYYDITSWMPAQRKEASFDGKDPLSRSMIKSIKEGLVMQLA